MSMASTAWSAPKSEQVKAARADVKEGARLFKSGRFAEALARFLSASRVGAAIGDEAGLWFNIARCLEELDEHRKAIGAFEKYLSFSGEDARTRRRAQEKIRALEAKAFGQLTVECEKGVSVSLPGGPAPRACPITWRRLAPGKLTVEARDVAQGIAWTVPMTIEAGDALHTRLLPPGRLEIRGRRGNDRIFVDGAEVSATGSVEIVAAPGPHQVRVETTGRPPWTGEVQVDSETTTVVEPQWTKTSLRDEVPVERGPSPSWQPWVFGGVGAACLAGSAVAYFRTVGLFEDAEEAQQRYNASMDPVVRATQRRRANDALSAGRDSRTLTWVLGGAGAAFAGIALWLWLDDEAPEQGLGLNPEGQLIIWGRF
ncbi:MAG: PEGA domain-containing protein [Bradymonadia bacterium]